MDRLRERVNVKYGLDLGETCTTDPTLLGADGLHKHPCTRFAFGAVPRRPLLHTAGLFTKFRWAVNFGANQNPHDYN